jgi:hypothetical protein
MGATSCAERSNKPQKRNRCAFGRRRATTVSRYTVGLMFWLWTEQRTMQVGSQFLYGDSSRIAFAPVVVVIRTSVMVASCVWLV